MRVVEVGAYSSADDLQGGAVLVICQVPSSKCAVSGAVPHMGGPHVDQVR